MRRVSFIASVLALLFSLSISRVVFADSAPSLDNISPASGPIGTVVTLTGKGFDKSSLVAFGGGGISPQSGEDHSVLTFTVPFFVNRLCSFANPPCSLPAIGIVPGVYSVYVITDKGISNVVNFTVE